MPSRARLMASSATRWVRWRTKVKAHVLALICPSHACCSGCGSPLAPSWQAPRACKRRKAVRYTSRTTPHVTCVTRHAQNAKPTSRCRTVAPWSIPLHHGAPRCDGCYHPETTVKASPHRHKWMLSHGAPADPSDPWNFHAAPVSPRQNCALRSKRTVSCLKNSVGMRSRWVRITFGGVTSGTGGRSPPWDAHGPAGPAHNAAANTMLAMASRYDPAGLAFISGHYGS